MSNLTRAGELTLRRTLATIARRLAARNPFVNGKCEYCHAHENAHDHNEGCLWLLAHETRNLMNEVSQ